MKKIIILILIIIIPFAIFIIVSNTPRNYETKYTIDELEVNEQYNKDNQTYLFVVKKDKVEIPYLITHEYTKKRKLITNIKIEENCYTINVFENDYKLCVNDGLIGIDTTTNDEPPINSESNIKIYKHSEEIYIWNYKGYYKVENAKLKNISILRNDNYENNLSASNDKYLITANYDEKYEFTKFYIINKENNKISDLTLEKPISSNAYFLGTHNNKLYLLDPKYKYEYEIDPNKNKITIISKNGNGIYYDKEEVKISINKLIKEKLTFPENNPYNYNLEEDKLTLKINGQTITITKDKTDTIIKIINDTIYYLSDGTLYKYTFGKQTEKLISNTEWKFNTSNQIFIFN